MVTTVSYCGSKPMSVNTVQTLQNGLITILILFSHLRIGLTSGSLPSSFPRKT
jgi:hypothetical protein